MLVTILSSLFYEYIRYTDYTFDKDDDDNLWVTLSSADLTSYGRVYYILNKLKEDANNESILWQASISF